LAALVANDALIGLSVHLLCRLIDTGPVRAPLSARRFVFSRITHGFLSDRIEVLISAVAAGPDRFDVERHLLVIEGISAWAGPMQTR
jgi:hypothetical protein